MSDMPLDIQDHHPWPELGDQAFAPGTGSNRWTNADLRFARLTADDGVLATGFKNSGDLVVRGVVEHRLSTERMFYPVAYLYRHYVELALKDLIRMALLLELTDGAKKALSGHDLERLWRKARSALEAFFDGDDRTSLEAAESIVLQFHALDKSGQEFRYPRGKDKQPYLVNAPSHVSLEGLRDAVAGLAAFLDGCGTAFSVAIDHQGEVNHDYGN